MEWKKMLVLFNRNDVKTYLFFLFTYLRVRQNDH